MRAPNYRAPTFCILALSVLASGCASTVKIGTTEIPSTPNKLAVVWTSDDPYVAHRVCLMYTHAAKNAKWFKDVTLIIWGPSAKLITEDESLQDKVAAMQADGVVVQACIVCADAYGVTENLRDMGIEVKGMGKPLSDMLKTGWKVLTF